MLKLGSKPKAMGTTVACPACRHPNLGIDIWCERCGTPLDWNGQKLTGVVPWAPASDPPAPSPVVAPEPPDPPDVPAVASSRPLRKPAFSLPTLTIPAITWPRLTMPTFTLRRPRLRRVPRIAWVVVAVLAILMIAPLAYALSSGHPAAARQSTGVRLPPTNGVTAGGTAQAAAIAGVEAKTGLHYRTGTCATNAACLTLAGETIGQDAAAEVFSTAAPGGRECIGYVYKAGGSWHFLDAVCGLPGQLSPLVGHDATIHVPGNCANLRNGPSLKAGVVACLNDGTMVRIDGGPTYADSRLWWHEKRGWVAHDFLIGP